MGHVGSLMLHLLCCGVLFWDGRVGISQEKEKKKQMRTEGVMMEQNLWQQTRCPHGKKTVSFCLS